MSFSMERIRPFLALAGLLLLVTAVMLYLIYQDFDLAVRIVGAAGIILLGIYVAIDPEDFFRAITGQRALYSGNTAVMVIAVIAILAVINVLAARFNQRWDLTASGQFTLSERTLSILEGLQEPVRVVGFFQPDDPSRGRAEDLLKEYRVHASGSIEYEFVDPEINPGSAIQLGVRDYGTLVFVQGDRKQTVTGVSEQEFTTALLKLTRPDRKKVYFVQGHGERSLEAADQNGYTEAKRLLEQDNYEVRTVNLVTDQRVPADAAALVIAGPTNDFVDEEKRTLQEYLAGGGKLLLMKDPRTNVNLDALFSQWRITLGNDPVVDPGSAFLGDAATPVVQRYAPHAITENLRAASFFPLVAAINVPREQIQDVQILALAQSSDRSWIETDPDRVAFDEGRDTRGPVTLAAVIEASATAQGQTPPGEQAGARRTRVVIFGDSEFVANNFLRVPAGNIDLFLNAVNWLAEAEELISIRPKEQDTRQMFLTATQLNLIMVTSTIVLPLVVLLAGAAVWWTRR